MAVLKDSKAAIIKKHQRSELDTGSSEVQIALLTARINDLTNHFASHKKDVHSRRGLLKMVSRRRSLLNYLQKQDFDKYSKLINELGIRK